MVKKVLFPLDGSKVAEEKVPEAIRLLRTEGANLRIVLMQVCSSRALLPKDIKSEGRFLKKRATEYLNGVKKRIEGKGIEVEVVVKAGKPSAEICNYAAENDIDIVVLASQGHGKVSGWALGSVTDDVVRYCRKPVLIQKVPVKDVLKTSGR